MSEFIHVEPVRYWCHKILPLVYDDSLSYMELLNKVVYKLNEVVNNNNELPAYIAEQIKNYISSGEIKKVVQDILANYSLNVKFPPEGITPAVGDGTVDDTAAFQGCLDYAHAHGGMMVFVPAGKYLCGNLTMYSGCSIKGDGRYDTTIVMRGGVSNPFIGGELDAVQIADIGIDGNADIQVNNIDVFNVKLSNALLTNLFLTDGYTLLKIQENGGDIQIDNIVFDKAVVRAVDLVKGVSSRVQMNQVICRNVSKLNGESAIRIGTDGGFYDSIISVANAPIGIEVTGSNNYVQATVVNAVDSCKDTGENNNIKIVGENTNENVRVKKTVNAGSIEEIITGNKRINAESIEEIITGNKRINAGSIEENITGNKRINAESIEENITGNKRINTESIFVNTTTPIKYSKPTKLNKAFNVVPMIDKDGAPYNLLSEGENINTVGNSINLSMFGAVGDGVTDDTQAIKDCLAYAETNKKAIMGNFGEYLISDTIMVDGTKIRVCHIEGLIKPNFTDKEAIVIHNAGEHYQTGAGDYEFHVVGETVNGGYNFIGITDFNIPELPFKGISVKNCYHSNFLLTARNCHIGVSVEATDAGGNGGGSAYNTFNIPDVGDNAVSLDLMAKDNGWVNENLFLGVSVQDYTPNPGIGKTIGIRFWCNNSKEGINNNVFVKPCLQCIGLPVLLNDAHVNQFIGTRCESTSRPADIDYYIMCKGVSKNNLFQTLYAQDSKIYKDALSEANNYGNNAIQTGLAPKRKIFGWVYDKTKVVKYGDALIINELDNYCPYADTTSGQPRYAYGDFSDEGITTSDHNHIGRYFDVSEYPNITVCAHATGDFYLGVFLFDANFNYIDANENDVNETNGTSSYSTMQISNIGTKKYASTPTPANGTLYTFNIANKNAKYAFVGAKGNNINSLEFYSYEGSFLYKIKTNILPKRMVDIDGLKIPNPTGLKVANVGQFIRDNSGTISTESDGSYIVLGYVRTGGTDNSQEFKTVLLWDSPKCYFQRGSKSQPVGKPIADGFTDGYLAKRDFSDWLKPFPGCMAFSI